MKNFRFFPYAVLLVFLLTLSLDSFASRLPEKQVPEPLQPWIDWVLQDKDDALCPFLHHRPSKTYCAWPGRLDLVLSDKGSTFTQSWTVYRKSILHLPGNQAYWPQDVSVNNQSTVLINHLNTPALRLAPGQYKITGRFFWNKIPNSLQIPNDTGLLSVKVNGKAISKPQLDDNGKLWLRSQETIQEAVQDRLTIQVFRKITDDIPITQQTRIELQVSGQQRELRLGPVQHEKFEALSMDSPLPARWESDGYLQLQIRPGRWVVNLVARSKENVSSINRPSAKEPWPEQEVWVFDARNHIRLVEVQDVLSVDPRQTNLPSAWQRLPAYKVNPDQSMRLKVVRRGDPDPIPDQLKLDRNLWLDFDGGAYTIQDRISGIMTRSWRLEGGPELLLGQVNINGQAQFITRLPDSDSQGVEVRQGALNVVADSRSRGGTIGKFSAVGWSHDFQSVRGTLNYPPGWSVFALWGTDNVPNTWLQQWSLLDIFMLMILSVIAIKLWNYKAGILVFTVVAITWHEPQAPRYIWVNVLIIIALLRAVPKGAFEVWLRRYLVMSLLILVAIILPFMVSEVRTSLYPQLDRHYATPSFYQDMTQSPISQQPMIMPESDMVAEEGAVLERRKLKPEKSLRAKRLPSAPMERYYTQKLQQMDPNAVVQTGPGLPNWQWNSLHLSWNGPVQHDQQVRIIFMSPTMNKLLGFLRALGVLILVLFIIGLRIGGKDNSDKNKRKKFFLQPIGNIGVVCGLALVVLSGITPRTSVAADFPDQQLLQELQKRLLAKPVCGRECADISRLKLDVKKDSITGILKVHAQEPSAIPLPSHPKHWWPEKILVNGKSSNGSRRIDNHLWLIVDKGSHTVQFSGRLPNLSSVQLHLPLKPRYTRVTSVGWQVDGVHEDGTVEGQLQLTRLDKKISKQDTAQLEPGNLPTFVRVQRTLELDLDWYVVTEVQRASPMGSAAVIEVPLLKGESVTTEGIRVKEGKVLVSLGAQQHNMVWRSTLNKAASIQLKAPDSSDWTEVWKVNTAPVWHMSHTGLAPVHHKDKNHNWLPEWRPWPGESVEIKVSRPLGVEGATLTIDNSRLEVKPGKRSTEVTLTVVIRSSQGQQHSFILPESSELQSITIDRVQQPIRLKQNSLTFPVRPGAQTVQVNWRLPVSITSWFKTPVVDLGSEHVNQSLNLSLGYDRWVMLLGGPALGPAVLIWGVLIVLTVVSVGLGRLKQTPLKTHDWILLSIGLSQSSEWSVIIVIAWLLGLAFKNRLSIDASSKWATLNFNLVQVAYAVLSGIALMVLVYAVQHGLLGLPNMMVTGNNSSAYQMNWYQDRGLNETAQAWVLSISIMVYRLLMLAWALWLAMSLVKWLKWGWSCYCADGLWRKRPKIKTQPISDEHKSGNHKSGEPKSGDKK